VPPKGRTEGERKTFLERHLRETQDEGLKKLELHAYESFRELVRDMKDRAWECRQAAESFGKSPLVQTVVRRLERYAARMDRSLDGLMSELELARTRRERERRVLDQKARRREAGIRKRLAEWYEVADRLDRDAIAACAPPCTTMVATGAGDHVQCCRKDGHWGPHVPPADRRGK
jgi:hypothetical protein